MQIPVQITFRDIPHSDAIESEIHKKVEKLETIYPRLIACRVVLESEQRHQHQGKLYAVRVDLSAPGTELVATRQKHEDIYVALRDAFDAMKRQLQAFAAKQRGEVKTHEIEVHGTITRLFPEEGYGFIQGFNGTEYYFTANAVAFPDFSELSIGLEVTFIEGVGDNGPQAYRISAGKHHIPEAS